MWRAIAIVCGLLAVMGCHGMSIRVPAPAPEAHLALTMNVPLAYAKARQASILEAMSRSLDVAQVSLSQSDICNMCPGADISDQTCPARHSSAGRLHCQWHVRSRSSLIKNS